MTLTRPLWLEATGGDATFAYSAQEDRTLVDALVIGSGVKFSTDLAVSQRAAGANFSVDVAAGHCVIVGTSVTDQGKYVCQNTATFNVTIAGAPGSGTRFDLVYAQVRDKPADGGSAYDFVIDKVTGTVGAGLPTTPANAIPLAQIGPVISTTPSITTSLITSLRTAPHPVGGFYPRKVGHVRVTSSQTGFTTAANITAYTITFDAIASRLYEVHIGVPAFTTTSGDARVVVNNGTGTQLGTATKTLVANVGNVLERTIPVIYGTSGSQTVQLQLLKLSGGGTVDSSAATTEPGYLKISDLG